MTKPEQMSSADSGQSGSNAGLGVFCIGEQLFDALNGKCAIFLGKMNVANMFRVLLKKWNRWIAVVAVVAIPSFHEASAFEAPKMPSELNDRDFVSMEFMLKDSERVFSSISEIGKSVREGSMDTISGGQKASAPFTPQSKPMGGEGNKQRNDGANKGDDNWGLYVALLLMFWVSIFVSVLSAMELPRR